MAPGILLDGEVVAASDKNIIVTYPYTSMSERANKDIPTIEKLLSKVFEKEYNFVALDQYTWEKIKKEYIKNIKNKKEYNFINEDIEYEKIFSVENNFIVEQAIDIFGESLVQVI